MGLADRLPGLKPGSRVRNVIVGTVYVFVLLGVIGAILPGGGGGGADTSAGTNGEATVTDGGAEAAAATTATPTPTPEPTATPTPTPEPTPVPAEDGPSYSFDGNGNEVTDTFTSEGGLVTIAFTHDGESNFQVQAVSSDGDERYLVNDIGTYDGVVALNLPEGEWQLDITADGDWTAGVEQPRFNSEDVKSLPAESSGVHAAWFGPYEFDGSNEVTFEIENDAQAAVWLTNTDGEQVELLHNEVGPYEGSALVTDSGVGLIVVDTDSAEWRIEVST